ncbi:MAG: M3 family metallopeptidase [Zoogloeaceae bacterium]|jgi:oligopeptidase A|nr:M3 family metallopeptidase [Zoogloeaceae bacterium]
MLRRPAFNPSLLASGNMNPLLSFAALPDFDHILPEHVAPAVTQLLAEGRALIQRLAAPESPATWADFAAPLSEGLERLSRAWGVVGHLHSVQDVPDWRDAYNALLPEVTRFYSEMGQNLALFEKYKTLRASAGFARLSPARRRVVDNEIRDFRLSGAELPEADKLRFTAVIEELSRLAAKFSENLLDATNAFTEVVTKAEDLRGLPPEAVRAARETAESAGLRGWKFTLQAPSYLSVMKYAENRDLRYRLYRAYATRAAEFDDSGSKPEWNNAPLMRRMLELRAEAARLIGFCNFAKMSLATKMAESPDEVLTFLRDMAARARPFAERDMRELRAFAAGQLGLDEMEAWDMAYASEKLRQARYDFSEQEVRSYFTEPKVLAGLFRLVRRLYGVVIKPDRAPVWHERARFYRVENGQGELIGAFYLDLYAREEKRGGAWMDAFVSRCRKVDGALQMPIACLVCNFSRPLGDKPATFTHDEVETLFHEAGHAFHHLLTRMEDLGVSGINGVEWDAVELPSQFMENFCREWAVLKTMTAHVDTGKSLPRALFDRMYAARNFQSGMITLRQIEFALFDILLYSAFDPKKDNIQSLLDVVREEVAVFIPPAWQRFPNSFSHIFGGGYAAGYYSYKWAEVLSADAYAAFEETGNPLDAATGRRFLDEILAYGGARPALESFRAFRGRAPKTDALLRHGGMIAR